MRDRRDERDGPNGAGLVDFPLRASNEGFLRPHVPRAQEINRPPSPLLFREQRTGMDVAHITPFQSLNRLR